MRQNCIFTFPVSVLSQKLNIETYRQFSIQNFEDLDAGELELEESGPENRKMLSGEKNHVSGSKTFEMCQ